MNCKRCGSIINQGENFCRGCGAPIVSEATYAQPSSTMISGQQNSMQNTYSGVNQSTNLINQQAPVQQNYQSTNNQVQQNYVQYTNNNENQVSQSYQNMQYQNDYNDDETLIKAYIGKNVEGLMNGGFSWCALAFSTMYLLYRKMWLLALLWFVGANIISMFLPDLYLILLLGANIYLGTQFKKMYMKNIKEKVSKIKNENSGKTREELLLLCSNKGGVALWPIIVYFVLVLLIVLLSVIILLNAPSVN